MIRYITLIIQLCCCCFSLQAQNNQSTFKVISFYTAKNDPAHISFVHEANKWFSAMSAHYHFSYDSTANWDHLNTRNERNIVFYFSK